MYKFSIHLNLNNISLQIKRCMHKHECVIVNSLKDNKAFTKKVLKNTKITLNRKIM